MTTSRGKRVAWMLGALGLAGLGLAAGAFRSPIIERWQLHRASSPSPGVRAAALRSLGARATPRARAALEAGLLDPDPTVWRAACGGLEGLEPGGGAPDPAGSMRVTLVVDSRDLLAISLVPKFGVERGWRIQVLQGAFGIAEVEVLASCDDRALCRIVERARGKTPRPGDRIGFRSFSPGR